MKWKWNINKKLLIIAIILLFIFLIFKIPILGIIVGALLGFLSGTLYFGNGILSLFYGFPKALLGYLKKEFTIYPVLMFLAAPLLNLLLFLLVLFFLNLVSSQMSTTFVVSFLGALCWYVFGFIWDIFLSSKTRKIMKEEFEDNVKYYRIKETQNKTLINPNDFSNSQDILTEEERELREKIRKNPNDYEAHFQLGILLHDLKKYEEAEREYRESTRINPNVAQIHHNLERYNEAEKEYREAIRINPNLAEAHLGLGLLLVQLKRYKEAEEEFREAIRINPNLASARLNLGILYAKKGEGNKARREILKAKELFEKQGKTDSVRLCDEILQNL